MVAEPAGSKSGKLIDFEKARSALSRHQPLNSQQDSLIDLKADIMRQLNSGRESAPPSRVMSHNSISLIMETIRELEFRLQAIGYGVDAPVRPMSATLSHELRWIENRLNDIDARIAALSVSPDQRFLITESIFRARNRAREVSKFEPLAPLGTAHNLFGSAFQPFQTNRMDRGHDIGMGASEIDMRQTSPATNPIVPEALLTRPFRRETLYLLMDRVSQFWPGPVSGPAYHHARTAGDVARADTHFFNKTVHVRPADRFLDLGDRLKGFLALLSVTTQSSAVLRLSLLFFIASYFFLYCLRNLERPLEPQSINHTQLGNAGGAGSNAPKKTASQAARPELKVNSLRIKASLLSPEPISGSLKAMHRELPPRMDMPPQFDTLAKATSTGEVANPPQFKNDALTQPDAGDAAEQYDRATELYQSGDLQDAILLLEKSASQGSTKAQLQLGVLYLKGTDVPRNLKQARKWLEMAADNGDPNAMHNLAVLYSGGDGRKPDYTRASELFRRAAEQGVVDSMFNLGLAYEDGLGVERDMIQAWAWFSVAASQGDVKATQKRKKLDKFLDGEELYEAKLLANSLKQSLRNK